MNPALGADLPEAVRRGDGTAADIATIHPYVQQQIIDLSQTDDAKKASRARDNLVSNVASVGKPSTGFLDAYSSEVSKQLMPVMTNPSARVRLNAAIVTAKVAEQAMDARLAPLVLLELKDPTEGVALWGLKASHWILGPSLSVGSMKSSLIAAITTAVQHFGTGPIVQAGYDALAIDDHSAATVQQVLGPIQDLLTWRIQQYAKGAPPEPPADSRATLYLTVRDVWNAQKQPQQQQTAQLLVNLVGAASADLAGASPEDRDQLVSILVSAARAVSVVFYAPEDASRKAMVDPVTAPPAWAGPAAARSAAVVYQSLASKFPSLKPPAGVSAATTIPTRPAP